MSIRIIGGTHKRRTIETLNGSNITRPTSDRIRENLFNIFGSLENTVFIDLFSGTGAMGIEALSRGAKFAIFVESNRNAISLIQANLHSLNILPNQFFIFTQTVQKFLLLSKENLQNMLSTSTQTAQAIFSESNLLVYADPPYDSSWYTNGVADVAACPLIQGQEPFSTLVLEMSKGPTKTQSYPGWEIFDERVYGKTKIEFWNFQKRTSL
jgi:16S rRNA (guanine966-N2)-methyltransferase